MSQTIETLMELTEQKVANNEPITPSYWCEMALRVGALMGDTDNKLAHLEAELNKIECELLKQDMPSNKAKALSKASIDYGEYLRLKALKKRVENFMINARKRSQINEI